MKIVDVAESYSEHGGGVRTYMHQKMAAAASAGHEVVVVAPGFEKREERLHGGRIVWVPGPRSPFDVRYGLFDDEKAIHDILDAEAPDIVEGSSPWKGGRFVASWGGKAPKSFVYHTDPVAVWPETFLGHVVGFDRIDKIFSFYWRKLQKLASAYDATVVSGEWLANRLRAHGLPRPVPVEFGIDKAQFSPEHRSEARRRELLRQCGLGPEAKLVVIVSRLDPEKRVLTLIEGFRRAAKQRPMGCVVYGRGALQKLVERKINATPGVTLGGYVSGRDEMAEIMASADVFLHGSAAETYGLVVAEAICSGVPIVAPSRGGASALVTPEVGELYQPGSASGAAEALLRIASRNPRLMRRACAEAAREIRSIDQHFAGLFDLYGKMCGKPAVQPAPAAPRPRLVSVPRAAS